MAYAYLKHTQTHTHTHIHTHTHTERLWEARRSLYSQISTKGPRNIKHIELFPPRKGHITYYLPRRLGVDMYASLVTFVLSVW